MANIPYTYKSILEKEFGNANKMTFYYLNTQPVVRRKARCILNPRTQKQQANRSNMPFIINAFRKLRPLIIISMNNRPRSRSAYNEFMSRNLNCSMVEGRFYPERFQITTSDIRSTGFNVYRSGEETNKFLVTWDGARTGNQLSTDTLCAAIYTRTNNKFHYKITGAKREEKEAELKFNANFLTVAGFLYLFFVRQDYSYSSQSSVFRFDAIN